MFKSQHSTVILWLYINCAENGMNRNTFFYLEISSMNKVGILFPDDFITQDEDEE